MDVLVNAIPKLVSALDPAIAMLLLLLILAIALLIRRVLYLEKRNNALIDALNASYKERIEESKEGLRTLERVGPVFEHIKDLLNSLLGAMLNRGSQS